MRPEAHPKYLEWVRFQLRSGRCDLSVRTWLNIVKQAALHLALNQSR